MVEKLVRRQSNMYGARLAPLFFCVSGLYLCFHQRLTKHGIGHLAFLPSLSTQVNLNALAYLMMVSPHPLVDEQIGVVAWIFQK